MNNRSTRNDQNQGGTGQNAQTKNRLQQRQVQNERTQGAQNGQGKNPQRARVQRSTPSGQSVNMSNIPKAKNTADLKNLLLQYGNSLTPENKNILATLIREMEKGGDPKQNSTLQKLATQTRNNLK